LDFESVAKNFKILKFLLWIAALCFVEKG
jgi:hypothetical protein